jgi:hypothetical protein
MSSGGTTKSAGEGPAIPASGNSPVVRIDRREGPKITFSPGEQTTRIGWAADHGRRAYHGNPEVLIPYRKPENGTALPQWQVSYTL